MDTDAVARAVAALRAGEAVLLPTDGVYGLCAAADTAAPTKALYRLKGRGTAQPTAMIAATIDSLLERLPELPERSVAAVRALLPGAYTLVLPNPGLRFPWLNGARPETIGVRVALLPPQTEATVTALGAIVATSANEPGAPAASRLEDVPARIRAGCGAELDGGPLSGEASTVLDLTGERPLVLRAGAGSVDDALARLSGDYDGRTATT